MKPFHIVLIIVIITAIGIVISTMVHSSTYGDFTLAKKNPGFGLPDHWKAKYEETHCR